MERRGEIISLEGGLAAGTTTADGRVRVFKGIPYAKPPVAELRWRPPQPVEPWSGVRPATSFGPRCIQVPRPTMSLSYFPPEPESEDCLYLNIWAPARTGTERCPVMVWFHGGGYNLGSGSLPIYSGEGFARNGVVLVTLNYRLGRLGFLAHPELTAESGYGASGNYGLLDQLAALRWVQRNIASFGGDPACVTIFGQSAGALSVSYFMASPLAKGLFHRAIGQSGAGFGPVDRTSGTSDANQGLPDAERSGVELAARIGANSIAELRNRTPYEIQMARIGDGFEPGRGYDRIRPMNGRGRGAFDNAYAVVDGYVIPDTVRSIFDRGAHNDVPLITGSTEHEAGHTVQAPSTVHGYVDDVRLQYGNLAERFLQFYPVTSDEDCKEIGGSAIGDRIFTWQNWTWANAQARKGKSPVYFYRFTHVPPQPEGMVHGDNPRNVPRAYHGGELPYIFRSFAARDWPWRPVDHELSDAMSNYWSNFARTGNPNGGQNKPWPRFNPENPMILLFGPEISVGAAPNREKLKFWDDFYSLQPTCLAEYQARYPSAA